MLWGKKSFRHGKFWAMAMAGPLLWAGCGAAPTAAKAPASAATARSVVIKVAYAAPSAIYTPLWVAEQAGLFKKAGVRVKFVHLSGDPATMSALISNSVQIGAVGASLVQSWYKGNHQVIYVGSMARVPVFSIYGLPSIPNLQGLQGKTLAVIGGGATQDAAEVALKTAHIALGRVHLVDISSVPAELAELLHHKVDAAVLSAPIALKAKAAGMRRLSDIPKTGYPYPHGGLGVAKSFASAHPRALQRFMLALTQGVQMAKAHPGIAEKAIGHYARITSAQVLQGTYHTFAPYWSSNLSLPAAVVTGVRHLYHIPASAVNVKQLVDNQFALKAWQEVSKKTAGKSAAS